MRHKNQAGLTLIELMIAVALGIFISLTVVQYMVTSSRMFKRQGADTNLEQNASFALSYLSRYLRQAGSRDGHGTDVPFYIGDCGDFIPCTSDADGAGGSDANSDRVAVQMFPANRVDCTGLPATGQIANVFYISKEDPAAPNSLFCQGYDVAAEAWLGTEGIALIDGIDQMQVIYGIADENEQVYSYVAAANVPPVNGSPLLGWDQVRAVKVALLVSDGFETSTQAISDQAFQLFNSSLTNFPNDRVSRQVFSTSVTINSKIP